MIKNIIHLSFLFTLLILSFGGCSYDPPRPVKLPQTTQRIDYIKDVKPILDRRCVVCHSCYNSPCQLKLSSFDGLDRGGSKEAVYDATRLTPADPTRLFIDANSTEEWRHKGFFSVRENSLKKGYSDSILALLLREKKRFPEIKGSYAPEDEKLVCPKNPEEVSEYFDDKKHRGMPYGFPALTKQEYATLMAWIAQGTKGPTKEEQQALLTPSIQDSLLIQKYEAFLNDPRPKYVMTARYLYEHLFLAHIHFSATSKEYFQLVRSRTPAPQAIDIIPTVRPYDDPKAQFYYRFQKIHSTIVHKTHMVFTLDDKKFARIQELFIQPKWQELPHVISYDPAISANPFVSFAQIPPESRYRFLLENSQFIIMTFIRGPVCRGQVALSSINDHFWVLFTDPKYDIAVNFPIFIQQQSHNLATPIESGSDYAIYNIFSDDYLARSRDYFLAKTALLKQIKFTLGYQSIWKGDTPSDAPVLTVFRHHDSASVHRGVLGPLPKTLWVIDYPLFERIYYSLVAGYDVFGNLAHQVNIRRYMDFLRFEGELNFVSYMPKTMQMPMFKSWSIGDPEIQSLTYPYIADNNINYSTKSPKREFITHLVNRYFKPAQGIDFDPINYYRNGEKPVALPQKIETKQELYEAFKAVTVPGTEFVRHLNTVKMNIVFVKFEGRTKAEDVYTTFIVDRWHNNVNSMLNPDSTLDKSKDRLEIHERSIGSYPNLFAIVKFNERKEFFDMLLHFQDTPKYHNLLKHFGIDRADPNFWKIYDDFQEHFDEERPFEDGLYDLNRYFHQAL